MRARVVVGVIGVVAVGYGAFLLMDVAVADLVNIAVWLAGGVILHDFVLAPVALVLGALALRFSPADARAPLVVGLVVLGTVSLVAIPVLGRFGASPGNPTLLDRNYVAGWLVLVGLTAAAVVVATVVRGRTRSGHGPRAGG